MNAAGILIDLAHASLAATRAAVEVSTRPMMISHSNLRKSGLEHPRLITLEHARLVTDAGGVIGCVPAGWGQAAFADYIDTILRMVDALGSTHVAIGTDMDYTYSPVMTGYADWPRIPAALLSRGMHAAEVARVVGGNALRLLRATEAKPLSQPKELAMAAGLTFIPRADAAPFSAAVRVDNVLYLSGQIGATADGKLVEGFEPQVRQTMENIRAVLASQGLSMNDVFKCTVMLADMKQWPEFNRLYVGYFTPGRLPARSAMGVNGLAAGAVVEVECLAYMPPGR
jgi:reactive intermediate/imine deaminase